MRKMDLRKKLRSPPSHHGDGQESVESMKNSQILRHCDLQSGESLHSQSWTLMLGPWQTRSQVTLTLMPAVCKRPTLFQDRNVIGLIDIFFSSEPPRQWSDWLFSALKESQAQCFCRKSVMNKNAPWWKLVYLCLSWWSPVTVMAKKLAAPLVTSQPVPAPFHVPTENR